jgi:hypothetical protein
LVSVVFVFFEIAVVGLRIVMVSGAGRPFADIDDCMVWRLAGVGGDGLQN